MLTDYVNMEQMKNANFTVLQKSQSYAFYLSVFKLFSNREGSIWKKISLVSITMINKNSSHLRD